MSQRHPQAVMPRVRRQAAAACIPRALVSAAGLLLMVLALGFVVGCHGRPASQWPVQVVLATPDARQYLDGCDFKRYQELDGTVVRSEIVPADRLPDRLRQGGPAVVLLTDPDLFARLRADGLFSAPPWIFEKVRDDLSIIAPSGSTVRLNALEDLRTARVQSIGMADANLDAVGRLTTRLLNERRLGRPLEPYILPLRNEWAVYRQVSRGKLPLGIVTATQARQQPGQVREVFTIDPRPDFPRYVAGAVLARPADPVGARRLWNFMEKGVRLEECALISRPAASR